jgi:hypothetical protein
MFLHSSRLPKRTWPQSLNDRDGPDANNNVILFERFDPLAERFSSDYRFLFVFGGETRGCQMYGHAKNSKNTEEHGAIPVGFSRYMLGFIAL